MLPVKLVKAFLSCLAKIADFILKIGVIDGCRRTLKKSAEPE
jgi:hypothetical protein